MLLLLGQLQPELRRADAPILPPRLSQAVGDDVFPPHRGHKTALIGLHHFFTGWPEQFVARIV
ncbi:hypothetical protein [Iodidimonas sp. SYSU 1G8]|uniref:hypothetical protein n=1 Tax=Iodidimonas sp. SYSU 1G8 TaxID=3133967 RepID=UPI0031FEA831